MACEANIFEGNSRDVRLEKLYFKYITWCRETSPYARFFYFYFNTPTALFSFGWFVSLKLGSIETTY